MSIIHFSKTLNRTEFTEKIIENYKQAIEKAEKIFIKPNIVSHENYPTTTHPETLETILKQLPNHQIIIGDAPAIDAGRTNQIIKKSALTQICSKHNNKLINLYSTEMKTITSPRGYKTKIFTLPLTCNYIISLPVLKTHNICGMTGALKNQFGYLSKQDRLLMHAKIKDINKGIAEVNAAIPTNLFIIDAKETMTTAQECRHGGCPQQLGYLIAGTDPVALDYFGMELLQQVEPNFKQRQQKCLPYIQYAESIGVGSKNYKTIEI